MKQIGKYSIIFLALVAVCTIAMTGTAMIPREHIRSSMEASADYLVINREYFGPCLIAGAEGCRVDETADANLLNIAWFMDSNHPLESAMRGDCYYDYGWQRDMFREAVYGDVQPVKEYFRYWHGSLVFVRPLLVFWNIQQIYAFHFVVIGILFIGLLVLLFRHRLIVEGIGMILSMIAVNLWVVPMCLEFTWMFLVMFVVSIVATHLALQEHYKCFGLLFFITGIVTIFLDFFTTETLTISIPLLLTLRIRYRQRSKNCTVCKDRMGSEGEWLFALRCCILWALGYALMWAAKWAVASVVLKFNAFSAIQGNISEHLSDSGYNSTLQYALDILWKQLQCLFPIGYGVMGAGLMFLALLAFLFLPVYKDRVRLRQSICWSQVRIYAAIGLFPYIRYLIIPHHSWRHFFFTYRAQAATVMALCFVIAEVVQVNKRATYTVPQAITLPKI